MAADTPDAAPTSVPCSACRGTGRVTSNLGGERHEQPCPWCDGGGMRLPEHDAQAARRADVPGDDAA